MSQVGDYVQDAAALAEPRDAGPPPAGPVRRWLMELALASKAEENWRKEAESATRRYRGQGKSDAEKQTERADAYNVLYANVQTLQPILYNSTPEPVVQRRFDDADPAAKAACEVLRRAIKYTISCQDFDEVMTLAVQDYLLPGRAVVSVKYVPTTDESEDATEHDPDAETQSKPSAGAAATSYAPQQQPMGTPGGEQADANLDATAKTGEVIYEEVRIDLTPWKGFRRGPGRTWQDVPWIAFELELTREACVELFGAEIGNAIPLQSLQEIGRDKREDIDKEDAFKRARVWQIWDKAERCCIYVSPDYQDAVLKTVPDAYNLTGFFNVPRPMYAVETSDSLVPVTEFTIYKSLADEAEQLTNRLSKIARCIRVRGGYAAGLGELQRILEGEEGELTPVQNADLWMENGGIDKAIWLWPLDKLVQAYESLTAQREMIKASIYEILGIADIMRGATDPDETATAQGIKNRWGSLRTRRRQSEVQRFARDIMQLVGELIAEKFSPQTLAMITGLWFPSAQEKEIVQQTIAAAQMRAQMQPPQPQVPGQPPQQQAPAVPPAVAQQAQQLMALPTWDDIVAILRNDCLRHFRIDIQTDSTIALQDTEDQGDYAKMLAGVAQLFGELAPIVQGGILPFSAAKALILGLARKFRLGYEIEDELSQMSAPKPPDPASDPAVMKAKIEAQADAQSDQARAQADIMTARMKAQLEVQAEAQRQQLEARFNGIETLINGVVGVIERHVQNIGTIEAARVKAGYDAGADILTEEMAAARQQPQVPGMPAGVQPAGPSAQQ